MRSDAMKLSSAAALCITSTVLVYSVYKQYYLLSVLIIPVLCLHTPLTRIKSLSAGVIALIELFALLQLICIWYLFYVNFKSDVFSSPIGRHVSDHLVSNNFSRNVRADPDGLQNQYKNTSSISGHLSTPLPSYMYPVAVQSVGSLDYIPSQSRTLLNALFGEGRLFAVDFPDLRYRPSEEVRSKHKLLFSELPQRGFIPHIKNPCWQVADAAAAGHSNGGSSMVETKLACLPYAYVLGQPKSGTSDLYERMKPHQNIIMPRRKEVRWFTRGEFSSTALLHEGSDAVDAENEFVEGVGRGERLLGPRSSIYSFTASFREIAIQLTKHLHEDGTPFITIDGGPHTLWWPTQSPDGRYLPDDIPPPQLLREIQPLARLIVILADPVQRMYSDYYFLDDSRRPVQPGSDLGKSAKQFHTRVKQQIDEFNDCVRIYEARLQSDHTLLGLDLIGASNSLLPLPIWFRASQMCAHDRHRFAVAGWGRLAIGLYVLFIEKWLEHFPPDQLLIVRLEDQSVDPEGFMRRIFAFLDAGEPDEDAWKTILRSRHANSHRVNRDPILEDTETMLREFYRPYNDLLAQLMNNSDFKWELKRVDSTSGKVLSLRDVLLEEQQLHHLHQTSLQSFSHDEKKNAVIEHLKMQHHHQHHRHHSDFRSEHDVMALKDLIDGELLRSHDENGGQMGADHLDDPALLDRVKYMKYHMDDLRHRKEQQQQQLEDVSSGRDPIFDAHGFNRHQLGAHDAEEEEDRFESEPQKKKSLRGGQMLGDLDLNPMRFSIDGLHLPPVDHGDRKEETGHVFKDREDAASQLCDAAFTLNIARLKQLLYDIGVPSDLVTEKEAGRNSLHCLSLLFVMADAHRYSHVFSVLKGKESWMTQFFDPPLEKHQSSVLSRDIVSRLEKYILLAARWLLRAEVPVNVQDRGGLTPLHIASIGGELSLVQLLLESGADTSITNDDGRTALHYAVIYGHAEIAALLVKGGADLFLEDRHLMKPIHILENPGPIASADAMKYLNISQRPSKKIDRLLHPEDRPDDEQLGWRGDGGWNSSRLRGFEEDMECEGIDQYHHDELSSKDIFQKYIARNTPVLIRGLIRDWQVVEDYKYSNLQRDHAELPVQVSDIPYADKFGGSEHIDMKLGEYMEEVLAHRMVGGSHPWYVFLGNPIPRQSEAVNSLVRYDRCPTPEAVQHAFERVNPPSARGLQGAKSRLLFVNAQWAFGGEATGAPVHYHNFAWNGLIYGAKKWIVYPPHNMIMSNKQIYDYYETDLRNYAARGVEPITCVQTAGDVMIIPESWGHGVLNIQESVAIATESKTPMFRLKPQTTLMNKFKAAPLRSPHAREAARGG